MEFSELEIILQQENEIEKIQRKEGYNVNDQNLPFEKVAVPKMPQESFFKEGNIFINKHHRYSVMPAHTHSFVEFNYMLSGSCIQYVNGKEIILKQGELLLLDKDIVQEINSLNKDDILINILLKDESITTELIVNMVKSNGVVGEFLMNASNQYSSHDSFLHFHCGENEAVQSVLHRLILEYYNKENFYMRAINLLMSLLIIELTRSIESQQEDEDEELLQLLRYIEIHYPHLTLSEVSKEFGYNPNYISNKLKKQTGRSFKELTNYMRYQNSLELMRETNKSFLEIAYEVGYENLSSLYKLFAKYTRDTPKEIRKMMEKSNFQGNE
ncbi:helix-turn-helix domain-containing protein [Enterococcus sp. MJM12]|uniref:Helix-turn-helix domain-containing protein n=1 Tax=Candidatus Enterococcus myersii TaxID=2815322 RepID=A0ABS3HAF2_9ENTE|nr:AraC family transcriptional regulator [Enterococcus sp. MJM12]MBO0450442.1 helix-turn-helix domain-containing protein [Enterococcus sp. MJM12]